MRKYLITAFILLFSASLSACTKAVIIPHDSYHESQISVPAIRGNRTGDILFSTTC